MAGILKVDRVQSDSNLAFNIAGSNVAFMDATSLQMVGSNISVAGTTVISNGKVVASGMPTGAVLQVKSVYKQDTFTSTSSSYVDVTGLSVSITPTSATSNILVLGAVTYGAAADVGFMRLVRNSTAIQVGIGASNRLSATAQMRNNPDSADADSAAISFLDSPSSTSAVTYKVQIASAPGGYTTRINSSADDVDQTNRGRTASTLIVMEIAG